MTDDNKILSVKDIPPPEQVLKVLSANEIPSPDEVLKKKVGSQPSLEDPAKLIEQGIFGSSPTSQSPTHPTPSPLQSNGGTPDKEVVQKPTLPIEPPKPLIVDGKTIPANFEKEKVKFPELDYKKWTAEQADLSKIQQQAHDYISDGKLDVARTVIDIAGKKFPNDPYLDQLHAHILAKEGTDGVAMEYMDRAIKKSPNDINLYADKASMAFNSDRLEEARTAATTYLKNSTHLAGGDEGAAQKKAQMYFILGDEENARVWTGTYQSLKESRENDQYVKSLQSLPDYLLTSPFLPGLGTAKSVAEGVAKVGEAISGEKVDYETNEGVTTVKTTDLTPVERLVVGLSGAMQTGMALGAVIPMGQGIPSLISNEAKLSKFTMGFLAPELMEFNLGIKGAEMILPSKVVEGVTAPMSTALTAMGVDIEKQSILAKEGIGMLDMAGFITILHGAKKLGTNAPEYLKKINNAVTKLKNGTPLKGDEASEIVTAVSEATPQDVEQAVALGKSVVKQQEEVKEIHDIQNQNPDVPTYYIGTKGYTDPKKFIADLKALKEKGVENPQANVVGDPVTAVKVEEIVQPKVEMESKFKMPSVKKVYEFIENEHGRQGSEFIGENGAFQTKKQAMEYAKEVHMIFDGLPEDVPIYRAVQANEVNLDPYAIGESWTWDLNAAKNFAKMNLSDPKNAKIIKGYVKKGDIDMEGAVRQYSNFSDLMDADSEFELPINDGSKIRDLSVQPIKEATASPEPKPESVLTTPKEVSQPKGEGVPKNTVNINELQYQDELVGKVAEGDRGLIDGIKKVIETGEDYNQFIAKDILSPLDVVKTEDGKYKVTDGNHRLIAYKELGIEDIPINIKETPPTELSKEPPPSKAVEPVEGVKEEVLTSTYPQDATKTEAGLIKTPIDESVSKYGWTAKQTDKGYDLFNRNGKQTATVIVKGDKYVVTDMGGTKLLSGKGQLGKSVESVIKEYFYGKEEPLTEPKGKAEGRGGEVVTPTEVKAKAKEAQTPEIPLKEQKKDLISQVDEVIGIVRGNNKDAKFNELTTPESVQSLKEKGYEVEQIDEYKLSGDFKTKLPTGNKVWQITFDVEGDGKFRLNLNTLPESRTVIEKNFPVNPKTPENKVTLGKAKFGFSGKETISGPGKSIQLWQDEALSNYWEAVRTGNQKLADVFQEQLGIPKGMKVPSDFKPTESRPLPPEFDAKVKKLKSTDNTITDETIKRITDQDPKELEQSAKDIERKSRSNKTAELEEAVRGADEVTGTKTNTVRIIEEPNPNVISESEFYENYAKKNGNPPVKPTGIRLDKYGHPIQTNDKLYTKKLGEYNSKVRDEYEKYILDKAESESGLSKNQIEHIATTLHGNGKASEAESILKKYGYDKDADGKWRRQSEQSVKVKPTPKPVKPEPVKTGEGEVTNFNDFVKAERNKIESEYRKLTDKEFDEFYGKDNWLKKWRDDLMDRAEKGEKFSNEVLDSYVDEFGKENYFRSFRGKAEQPQYLPKDVRSQKAEIFTPTGKIKGTAGGRPKSVTAPPRPTTGVKEKFQSIDKKEQAKAEKNEIADKLLMEGIDGLMNKIGAKKNLIEADKTTIIQDARKIIEGLTIKAGLTFHQAVEKILEKLKELKGYTDAELRELRDELYPKSDEVREKAVVNRLMTGDKISSETKKGYTKSGLTYEVKGKEEAREVAKVLIDEYGIDEAVLRAEGFKYGGDVNSAVFAESLDKLGMMEFSNAKEEYAIGKKFADISMRYDKLARESGRFTSYIDNFYKKSPLGMVLKENQMKQEIFEQWFSKKEKSYKDILDEMLKTDEGKELLEGKISEKNQSEVKANREKRRKKIVDIFDKAKLDTSQMYTTLIPPDVINGAIEVMKQATLLGESGLAVIEKGIAHIKANHKDKFDEEKFRKYWQYKFAKEIDRTERRETPEENRIASRIESLEKNIANYEKKLKNKEFGVKGKREETDPRILELISERDELRKEYEAERMKSDEGIQRKKQQWLDRFRKRLTGMNERQKEEVVTRSMKKILDKGGLEYEDFRKIIADVVGLGEMTPEQTKNLKSLVSKVNAVEELSTAMLASETRASIDAYKKGLEEAKAASRELGSILHKPTSISNMFWSLMKLRTLGAVTLLKNPGWNVFYMPVRFGENALLTAGDLAINLGSRGLNKVIGTKIIPQERNIIAGQVGYFPKAFGGLKSAGKKLYTGLGEMDYFSTDSFVSPIRPLKAGKTLWKWAKGEEFLTKPQVIEKIMEATAYDAEAIARGLTLGDQPFRWGAEGAEISQIAMNEFGLKPGSIQYELLQMKPKEEAYRLYLKKGLSEADAMKRAEDVLKRVVSSGEEAVMQQNNYVNDLSKMIDRGLLSDKDKPYYKVINQAVKALKNLSSPYVKIPSNIAWELYNLANPELALAQSAIWGTGSAVLKIKGKNTEALIAYRNSTKWMATAGMGYAIRATVGALISAGLLESRDDDKNKKAQAGEKFYGKPNSLNVTGLRRFLTGGDPTRQDDDLLVDVSWLGIVGNLMNVHANTFNDKKRAELQDEEFGYLPELTSNITNSTAEALTNGVFSGYGNMMRALSQGGGYLDAWGMNMINLGINVIQPATYAQLSKATLPTETTYKADTFLQEIWENQKQRDLFMRWVHGQPRSRISMWGEPITRDTSFWGVTRNMLGFKQADASKFGIMLYNDYRESGNSDFFPPITPKTLKVDGKNVRLTTNEQDDLDRLVGIERKNLVSPYIYDMTDYPYSKDSTDVKIKYLKKLYEKGYKYGVYDFKEMHPKFKNVNDSVQ